VSARLASPEGVLVYGDVLLVTESGGLLAIDLQTRILTRWAGTGTAGVTGDGLFRLSTSFDTPHGLAVLPDNSVILAQYNGCRIGRITTSGVARRLVGTGTCSVTGNGGSALSATVDNPVGLAVGDSSGTTWVYWADTNRVRAVLTGDRCEGEGGGVGRGRSAVSQ